MSKEQLLEAIENFFSDTSRSPEETHSGLEEAAARIEVLLDALAGQLDD